MERENFYILLSLPFDPPENDSARIRTALHRKKQEWTREQEHPSKRNIALRNLGLVQQIESVMLDPIQRKQEAATAKQLAQKMLRQFDAELRILEAKGYILPKEATTIANKYQVYGINIQTVQERAKCPIAPAAPTSPPPEPATKPLERTLARSIRRNLSLLGPKDLYSFLGLPPYSSIEKLLQAAESRRRSAASSGAKDGQVTITQELAGICMQVFADFYAKQRYDRYLRISHYPLLNDLIEEENTREQYISSTSLLRLVNFGVETYGIKVLEAEESIRNYCTAYDIPVDSENRYISCPACGGKTDGEGAVCRFCATPLCGTCPDCATNFSQGAAICVECGFALSEMGRALPYLDKAQSALIENNWSTAQRNIQFAEKFWPNHPKLEALIKRTQRLQDRYTSYVDSITDCIQHRQFYAALELIQEAQDRRMRLPVTITQLVDKTIEELEEKIASLQQSGLAPTFEQVLALTEIVTDSMEVSRLLACYPPPPPSRLRAIVCSREVRLDWGTASTPGKLEYVLVRKQDSAPLTAYDGEVLYKGSGNSFLDTTADSLCTYYYQVYTKRSGCFSESGAATDPVLIVPEIEGLRIVPSDSSVHLSWNFNPDVREVMIWRKLGGDLPRQPGEGIRLENTRLDGFTDVRLKNNVEYWYYVVAVYVVNGRKIYSYGVCESVTPHTLVAPIDHLTYTKIEQEENQYIVHWESEPHQDILFLASSKKPNLTSGQALPIDRLLTEFRRLDIEYLSTNRARFCCRFTGGLYVFAAVVHGKFATVGTSHYLTNVRDVENVTYDIIGEQLFINMKWPSGLHEVRVCYRFDRFPKSPDESGTTKLCYTRQQYDYDAAILLREPENMCYYFNIYSCFTAPDGSKTYSKGVPLLVNNYPQQEIFYQLQYSRFPLASQGKLLLTMQSSDPFTLPHAVIVGKVGRLPLGKDDGITLFTLDKSVRTKGKVIFQYRTDPLPENLYVRLFLQEEEQYEQFRLLALSNLKIN